MSGNDCPEYARLLNPQQFHAVTRGRGAVAVLAGPGSGKTRVIVSRAMFLHHEVKVPVSKITAVTFTNRTCAEMKERLVAAGMTGVTVLTFHRLCLKLLRRYGSAVGVSGGFGVCDRSEQVSCVSGILKAMGPAAAALTKDACLDFISQAKNKCEALVSGVALPAPLPSDFTAVSLRLPLGEVPPAPTLLSVVSLGATDPTASLAPQFGVTYTALSQVFSAYSSNLAAANKLDFDDMLLLTVRLLERVPAVAAAVSAGCEHLLVDEFQDTNALQYRLVKGVTRVHGNVFVVGDPYQCIYTWRFASPDNLNRIAEDFREWQVVMLEQNYRSCPSVLAVANAVIASGSSQNDGFRGKLSNSAGNASAGDVASAVSVEDAYFGSGAASEGPSSAQPLAQSIMRSLPHRKLWTTRTDADLVTCCVFPSDEAEASYIADELKTAWIDPPRTAPAPLTIAVLSRTAAVSKLVEKALVQRGVPYKIAGGTRLFEHQEIKDLLSYIQFAHDPKDLESFKRAVGCPRRGVGPSAVVAIAKFAKGQGGSLLDACGQAVMGKRIPDLQASSVKALGPFVNVIVSLRAAAADTSVPLASAIANLLSQVKFQDYLQKEFPSDHTARTSRVVDLLNVAKSFDADMGATDATTPPARAPQTPPIIVGVAASDLTTVSARPNAINGIGGRSSVGGVGVGPSSSENVMNTSSAPTLTRMQSTPWGLQPVQVRPVAGVFGIAAAGTGAGPGAGAGAGSGGARFGDGNAPGLLDVTRLGHLLQHVALLSDTDSTAAPAVLPVQGSGAAAKGSSGTGAGAGGAGRSSAGPGASDTGRAFGGAVLAKHRATAPFVTLCTVHAAKGMEWDVVVVAGAEANLFPHARSLAEDGDSSAGTGGRGESGDSAVDEERRLLYVAVTRARQKLYITRALKRVVNGRRLLDLRCHFTVRRDFTLSTSCEQTLYNGPCPFLAALPEDSVEVIVSTDTVEDPTALASAPGPAAAEGWLCGEAALDSYAFCDGEEGVGDTLWRASVSAAALMSQYRPTVRLRTQDCVVNPGPVYGMSGPHAGVYIPPPNPGIVPIACLGFRAARMVYSAAEEATGVVTAGADTISRAGAGGAGAGSITGAGAGLQPRSASGARMGPALGRTGRQPVSRPWGDVPTAKLGAPPTAHSFFRPLASASMSAFTSPAACPPPEPSSPAPPSRRGELSERDCRPVRDHSAVRSAPAAFGSPKYDASCVKVTTSTKGSDTPFSTTGSEKDLRCAHSAACASAVEVVTPLSVRSAIPAPTGQKTPASGRATTGSNNTAMLAVGTVTSTGTGFGTGHGYTTGTTDALDPTGTYCTTYGVVRHPGASVALSNGHLVLRNPLALSVSIPPVEAVNSDAFGKPGMRPQTVPDYSAPGHSQACDPRTYVGTVAAPPPSAPRSVSLSRRRAPGSGLGAGAVPSAGASLGVRTPFKRPRLACAQAQH